MIGQQLGTFHIVAKIGSGAMGDVYRAIRKKGDRTWTAAVKVVSPELLDNENSLKRFEREFELLKQLSHPNIIRYYGHGKSKGTWYYAMEFIDGETVEAVLKHRGPLPWLEATQLITQLCRALQYAHNHQVVHRDLKPSNLMIDRSGCLKLADFGIAKDLDATEALTKTGRTLGTAAYMAPEQIRGTPSISHKTDLYALGCLFFQLLTGEAPFEGQSAVATMHAHLSQKPPRCSLKNPEIPKEIDSLIARMMSKDPVDRPWDAQLVADQLENLLERAKRGEAIPTVFEKAQTEIATASGLVDLNGSPPESSVERRSRQTKGTRGTRGSSRTRTRSERRSKERFRFERKHFETGMLAVVLVALLGLCGYLLWPKSPAYLYNQASLLMESERPSDWKKAYREYIEPLERRYPEHSYQREVQEWLDRIELNNARDRAEYLLGPLAGVNRPRDAVEALYKNKSLEAAEYESTDQYARTVGVWNEYLAELKARGNPEERGWLLLGMVRLQEAEDTLNVQRTAARTLFSSAEAQFDRGSYLSAKNLYNQLINDYSTAAIGDLQVLSQLISVSESKLGKIEEFEALERSNRNQERTEPPVEVEGDPRQNAPELELEN